MPVLILLENPSLFVPHGTENPSAASAQAAFLGDYENQYVAFVAGWGGGKTWAGARKLIMLHERNAFDKHSRATYVKGLAIAPTYQLAATVMVPEIIRALDEAKLAYRFHSDPKRYCFVLPEMGTVSRPSEILVRSAETPSRIAGFEVGHIWGDEVGRWHQNPDDPMDDAMLQAEGRLRDPKARILQANYTFTHEGDCTTVYRRFEEEAHQRPGYAVYRGATRDNPLMRAYDEEKRSQLSPELIAQYLDGKAISRRGSAVYNSFDPLRNTDETLSLAPDLPLHLSIDFNIDPGMHAIIGQHHPAQNILTALHEIHEPRMDLRRMIHSLRDLIEFSFGGWRWPALWVFGDATGSSKWAGSGQSCWEIVAESLRQAGIPYYLKVPKSNPPVADRVNAFNCALASLDGQTRYKLHPRCKLLHRDLKQMRWTGGQLDKRNQNLSHSADAEGYRVHWLIPIRALRQREPASVGFSK